MGGHSVNIYWLTEPVGKAQRITILIPWAEFSHEEIITLGWEVRAIMSNCHTTVGQEKKLSVTWAVSSFWIF